MTEPTPVSFPLPTGVTLVGDAWGAPDAPPVLLLHGGGQTRHAWRGTALALATAGFRAVAVDQRGHGDSDRAPDGFYRIDAFAADMRALARTFPPGPAVVGASLGGIAALLGEGDSESSVARAVVLVDITPQVDRAGVERVVNFMQRHMHDGFGSLEEVADYVASYLPHRPRPTRLDGLAKNLRQRDGRWYWHWDPAFLTDIDARMEDRDPTRLEAAARRLDVPTLLIRGGSSDLVTPETARAFLSLVPQAEFVDVAGAGHMVAGDENDAFTTAVLAFLARVFSPALSGSNLSDT